MGIKKKSRHRRCKIARTFDDVQRKLRRDQQLVERRVNETKGDDLTLDNLRAQIEELLRLSSTLTYAYSVGWVYLCPTVRLIEGLRYCKIGISHDPDERFKSLCSNNPHALDLAQTRAFRGNYALETTLKVLTAKYTTDAANEWRAFPPRIYDLLAKLLPQYTWSTETFTETFRRSSNKRMTFDNGLERDDWSPLKRRKLRSSGTSLFGGFRVPELSMEYAPSILPFAKLVANDDKLWTNGDELTMTCNQLFLLFTSRINTWPSSAMEFNKRFVDILGSNVARLTGVNRDQITITRTNLVNHLPDLFPLCQLV